MPKCQEIAFESGTQDTLLFYNLAEKVNKNYIVSLVPKKLSSFRMEVTLTFYLGLYKQQDNILILNDITRTT